MAKITRNLPSSAPHIDDFLRAHGGVEAVKWAEAARIMGVGTTTVTRLVSAGRLEKSPTGKILTRSIHAYLWPATTALRVVK